MAAVTKELGIHIPQQIMKRHLTHGITDSKSLLQTVKLLFLSVKPLTGRRPTRDREAYNIVEIYLVC